MSRRPVRIGNASGFYGDRLTAMRDLVAGTDIDVITGDYLAELTMLILWKAKQKNPDTGYARTFLTQFEQVVTDCGERGIKIVVNAGGLNPAGMAAEVRRVAAEAGVRLTVAHVEGDDLIPQLDELRAQDIPFNHLDTGSALADAGVHPVSGTALPEACRSARYSSRMKGVGRAWRASSAFQACGSRAQGSSWTRITSPFASALVVTVCPLRRSWRHPCGWRWPNSTPPWVIWRAMRTASWSVPGRRMPRGPR